MRFSALLLLAATVLLTVSAVASAALTIGQDIPEPSSLAPAAVVTFMLLRRKHRA